MGFNITSNRHFDLKNQVLKRRLLETINAEKSQFSQYAEVFYAKNYRSDDDLKQLCEKIVYTVDRVLSAEEWEASLFLRSVIRPLKKIHAQAIALLKSIDQRGEISQFTPRLLENGTTIYVSLYQSNGHDIRRWEQILTNISTHMVGRPIYQSQQDVEKIIRIKLLQTSEAYAVVNIDPKKIISLEGRRPLKDRLGSQLISLLPGAVQSSNILEFVHLGKNYHFHEDQLILKTPEEMK